MPRAPLIGAAIIRSEDGDAEEHDPHAETDVREQSGCHRRDPAAGTPHPISVITDGRTRRGAATCSSCRWDEVAHGRDGWEMPSRTQRGCDRRHHGDDHAEHVRPDEGGRGDDGCCSWGCRGPTRPSNAFSPTVRPMPVTQPDGRGNEADHHRFEQHRSEDLALTRTDRGVVAPVLARAARRRSRTC